jgi:glycine cleavage system transcriptional repressor
MSRDRIGIIAEVAGAISALQGDITDLRQSVLRGYFTMILLARFPRAVSAEAVRERIAIAGAAGAYGVPASLEVTVIEAAGDSAEEDQGLAAGQSEHNYLLTARGPDRIGFVAAVSAFCARNRLNILDLSTMVHRGDYVMMLLVDVSRCGDLDAVRRELKAFGGEAGLDAVLQHEAIFRATNEVDL